MKGSNNCIIIRFIKYYTYYKKYYYIKIECDKLENKFSRNNNKEDNFDDNNNNVNININNNNRSEQSKSKNKVNKFNKKRR